MPASPEAPPAFVPPQLATAASRAPDGEDWLHEVKFDGYRMIAAAGAGRVSFWSRNRKDWSARLGRLGDAVRALPARRLLLDGEVVVLAPDGRTSFESLKDELGAKRDRRLIYQVFDLLHLDGGDLGERPLLERKQRLEDLCAGLPPQAGLLYSDHVRGSGPRFFAEACRMGLEGTVAKLAAGRYRSGRGREWLKVRCARSQEFVVVGYLPSDAPGWALGSLLLAVNEPGSGLVYAGRVGTGLRHREREALRAALDACGSPARPVARVPSEPALRAATWCEPRLVVEVGFTEWTRDGRLRHPTFRGLREDKEPGEVVRE